MEQRRNEIIRKTEIKNLRRRFCVGVGAIIRNPFKLLLVIAYLLMAFWAWQNLDAWGAFEQYGVFELMLRDLYHLAFVLLAVLLDGLLIIRLGTPWGAASIRDALRKAGLVNHIGEAPILLSKIRSTADRRLQIWRFDPCAVPASTWMDRMPEVETALNITIISIGYGDSKKTIVLKAVSAKGDLPGFLEWNDELLPTGNFELLLGEGLTGPLKIDLSKVPHVLLGGSSGSGKTVLLKLLLMQAHKKGASICIADFKGGLDFPRTWRQKCHVVLTEDSLLKMLKKITDILEVRKTAIAKTEYQNIDEYNAGTGESLSRIIVACDEVAEVLDKNGRTKEQKELIMQIESHLSLIARQGRALGIHLILATQRPDANILNGQIKSNMDYRICGRADEILSRIILDNTEAAEKVPKEARGRFVTNDGTVFQSYWFDQREL